MLVYPSYLFYLPGINAFDLPRYTSQNLIQALTSAQLTAGLLRRHEAPRRRLGATCLRLRSALPRHRGAHCRLSAPRRPLGATPHLPGALLLRLDASRLLGLPLLR